MVSNTKQKARVMLVYPTMQFEFSESPRPDGSLGLLYIAGILRDNGISVSLLDMSVGDEGYGLDDTFYRREIIDDKHIRVGMSRSALKEKLKEYNIVGVSSIYTPQTYNALEVGQIAKELDPNILTVAGGGNARAFHQFFLENGFDYVVFGEGEQTMLEIVRSFENCLGPEDIKNVAYKGSDGRVVINPMRPVVQDLDQLPFPAWDLLPLQRYWEISAPHGGTFKPCTKVRYLNIQTSRGCSFRCKYCHISKEGDGAFLRFKSYDRVMAEIRRIKDLGAEYLYFEDDSLLAKRRRIKEIFRGLKGMGLKIIDANGLNISQFYYRNQNNKLDIDVELLDLMRNAGWVEAALGFESGSQRILDKYASKKYNTKHHDAVDLVKLSVEHGLRLNGFFTIGYPDETYDELTQTVMFAKMLKEAGLSGVDFYIVTPYPGSMLYDMAVENGNLPSQMDLLNILDMKFALPTMTKTIISPEVLRYTRQIAYNLINSKEYIGKSSGKSVGSSITVSTCEEIRKVLK